TPVATSRAAGAPAPPKNPLWVPSRLDARRRGIPVWADLAGFADERAHSVEHHHDARTGRPVVGDDGPHVPNSHGACLAFEWLRAYPLDLLTRPEPRFLLVIHHTLTVPRDHRFDTSRRARLGCHPVTTRGMLDGCTAA